MAYDKKTSAIPGGPDTDFAKELFQQFEEMDRQIIAENPNCPPELIESYKKLKKANKAVKDFENLKALSELGKAYVDALTEDGLFRVKQLAFLSLQQNASVIKKQDWSIIAHHFNCKHELTDADVSRIRNALNQYHFRNKFGVKSLPEDLISVFDRLFSTKSATTNPKTESTNSILYRGKLVLLLQKINSLSKLIKAAVAFMMAWTIYVIYRTYGDHELLGSNLQQWDGDNLLGNLLIVPLSIATMVFIVRWVLTDKK